MIADALRGAAGLLVPLFHISEPYGWKRGDIAPVPQICGHGYLCVEFFLLLMGFMLAHAYDRRWREGMGVGAFFRRRLLRLHPLVVSGAVIGVIVFFAQGMGCPLWDKAMKAFGPWELTGAIAAGLLLLPYPGTGFLVPFNPCAWTLCYEYVANILYALFVRYSVDAEYKFTYPRGLVAIYDAETGKLQDTVRLVTDNPTSFTLYAGALYVASLGKYNENYGTDPDDNRGVEKVDLKAKKSELIISGEKLGAGIYGFVADAETAYAAIYNSWGSTPVVKIDLEKKTFEKVEGIADAQKTMAVKNGVLYVGDHTYGEEKVYVYKDGKLKALEQPKGAQAPYSIALF